MTKKRFYQLLDDCAFSAQHPGRFQMLEVWDEGRFNVTKVLLLLVFKNDCVLCVDRRFTANLMGGRYEAKETFALLQNRYQRWYNEWLRKKG